MIYNTSGELFYLFIKRGLDLLLIFACAIVIIPLSAVISLIIIIFDGPPVLFFTDRVGKDGKLFKLYKFRTMVRSDKPHSGIDLVGFDPRVTGVGRFLRAIAMDELPQVINIIKGDMSFVGPKPLPYLLYGEESIKYKHLDEVPGYSRRIKVLPGLTGMAQIYLGKCASRRDKIRYDNIYAKHKNICLDIKLIAISFLITSKAGWQSERIRLQ